MANEKQQINPNILLIAGGAVVGYFGIIKPLLESLGIMDSATKKANDLAATSEDAWKPQFWQQAPAGALIITSAAKDQFVKTIWDYPGILRDNYAAVLGVIKQLKTKSQISYLADAFQKAHKNDLYDYLRTGKDRFWFGEGLSQDHLAELNKIVSNLPKYNV